jgi:hypothetical protein
MAILLAFYVWFGAPVFVGWMAFMFLKSVLAEGRGAPKIGLIVGVLGLWGIMLAIQFRGRPQKI